MSFPRTWTLADIVDFEHLLADDAAAHATLLSARDRTLFHDRIAPQLAETDRASRPVVLRAWLELRRAAGPAPLAGNAVTQARRAVGVLAAVTGGLLGAGVAAGLLAGAADAPVNVLIFLLATVGVQWLLIALALAAALAARLGLDLPSWRGLLSRLLARLAGALGHLPGEQRSRLRAALGEGRPRGGRLGALLGWPLLALTQWVGVAFNVGVLVAMLGVYLPFTDLRFGWQSTYDVTPMQVQALVDTLAAPWQGLVPQAHPSAADIEATRHARGQPAATLPPSAARAWWPFLAMCVAVYGLAWRLPLLAAFAVLERRQRAAYRFDHPDANALWRRLQPLVGASGGDAVLDVTAGPAPAARPAGSGKPCRLLVADGWPWPLEQAAAGVLQATGWAAVETLPVRLDDRHAMAALPPPADALARTLAGVAVVVLASRDPIVAIAQALKEAANQTPEGVELLLLLATRGADGQPAAPDDERLDIWRRFVRLHGLPVTVLAWGAP